MFINGFRVQTLGRQVLNRYRGGKMSARLFMNLRWRWTPYAEIAAQVPKQGIVLDLGCGHGLLSMAMALSEPGRIIRGIDHDSSRITLAQQAAVGVSNVSFATGGLLDALDAETQCDKVAAIVIMDAIHYLNHDEQELFLARAWQALQPGGVLLIRDVDAGAGKNFIINRLYERAMTGLGFTRADLLHFRTQSDWLQLLSRVGFDASSEPCSRFPFADLLFSCRARAVTLAAAA